MAYILGIDTGGTYTDSVIADTHSKEIVSKAKALTTKENIILGIKESVNQLDPGFLEDVISVTLSTTLATNAVVENRGAPVGLIYTGEELSSEVPDVPAIKVAGKLDILGRETEPLQKEQVLDAVEAMKDQVEAIAVSGYGSTRNPEHEQQIKQWIREKIDMPVICGYELTSALGFQQRTTTAVINGSLIPIINQLLDSVKEVMADLHIDTPLMVVRGNGTLMSEATAREKPIESILSGPAASMLGGTFLSGVSGALILDMGGTTTDIAHVQQGSVRISKSGAKVGGWFTRVEAAQISTFPLGGDSYIRPDKKGNLMLGPERVIPVSRACSMFPRLENELRSFSRRGEYKAYFANEADCYMIGKKPPEERFKMLRPEEQQALLLLEKEPHSLTYLAEKMGLDGEQLELEELVRAEFIYRIAFTPTDLFHVQGKFRLWNIKAAEKACRIFADRLEISLWKFCERVEALMKEKAACDCFQACLDFDGVEIDLSYNRDCLKLLNDSLWHRAGLLKSEFSVTEPVIAIGAPSAVWAPILQDCTRTEVIVPPHAEVANAVGAAICRITESIEMTILLQNKKTILSSKEGMHVYDTEEEAHFYAVHLGRREIEHALRRSGFDRCEITEEIKQNEDGTEKKLTITGVGI